MEPRNVKVAGVFIQSGPRSTNNKIPDFLKNFIYLFMRDREREREAETQAEGEAGSMQGTRCETRSRVPRIMPWAEGGAKLLSHLGCPEYQICTKRYILEESLANKR